MAQFLDQVYITLESGSGGNGAVAWRREKFIAYGGPAGGDGGQGGHVYIQADDQLQTLIDYHYQNRYSASVGQNGKSKNQHGRQGEDLILPVPVGTVITDAERDGEVVADLTRPGQRVLVARGGRGGRGNARFASSRNKAPYYAEPGEAGVVRTLVLTLKLLADIGLVGLPNAGKSTLISVLSAAKPKIAPYPFTTLQPNLGVVRKPTGDGVVVADIPGLVEGASEGVGLGHAFLRHVERTRLLLHLVDLTAIDGGTPLENYRLIQRELQRYSAPLASRPQRLVLTKADVLTEQEIALVQASFAQEVSPERIHVISAATGQGLEALKQSMLAELDELLAQAKAAEQDSPPPLMELEDAYATPTEEHPFTVEPVAAGEFLVQGDRVERWLSVTDTTNLAALKHFRDILKAMGVLDALHQAGAHPGDTIYIGEQAFDFYPDESTMPHFTSRRRKKGRSVVTDDAGQSSEHDSEAQQESVEPRAALPLFLPEEMLLHDEPDEGTLLDEDWADDDDDEEDADGTTEIVHQDAWTG